MPKLMCGVCTMGDISSGICDYCDATMGDKDPVITDPLTVRYSDLEVKLVWATPNADGLLGYIARVSNPDNQNNESVEGLFNYMSREGHVSPFTLANMCVEVNTTRDISRQILRHWSLDFQEFSQRYQDVSKLGGRIHRECRLQDQKNRQNSIASHDDELHSWFEDAQIIVWETAMANYQDALARGVAKECARVLLPEGLTPTRMYINGNFRSWIHYLKVRTHESNQKEHRTTANLILRMMHEVAPITARAFFGEPDMAIKVGGIQ